MTHGDYAGASNGTREQSRYKPSTSAGFLTSRTSDIVAHENTRWRLLLHLASPTRQPFLTNATRTPFPTNLPVGALYLPMTWVSEYQVPWSKFCIRFDTGDEYDGNERANFPTEEPDTFQPDSEQLLVHFISLCLRSIGRKFSFGQTSSRASLWTVFCFTPTKNFHLGLFP